MENRMIKQIASGLMSVSMTFPLLLTSCADDPNPYTSQMKVTTMVLDCSSDSVTLRSIISGNHTNVDIESVEIDLSKSESFDSYKTVLIANGNVSDTIVSKLFAEPDNRYYYRYRLINEVSTYTTDIGMFSIDANQGLRDIWQSSNPIPAEGRESAFALNIGGTVYTGLGINEHGAVLDDIWTFDGNNWKAETKHPAGGLTGAVVFEIDGTIYITLGKGKEWYEPVTYSYNTATKEWKYLSRFPEKGRTGSSVFTCGGKAYVVGGYSDVVGCTSDVYSYEPETDSWTKMAPLPDSLTGMFCFEVNGRCFVGGGYDSNRQHHDNVYEYKVNEDKWIEVASFPQASVNYATSYSVGNDAYVLTSGMGIGEDGCSLYKYTPSSDNWERVSYSPGMMRERGSGVVIDDVLYLFFGRNRIKQLQTETLRYALF